MGKYCTKKRDQLCHPGSFDSAQDKLHAARRAVEGSRQGFTLMELMVYIAIVGIVVIVAGQAFSNSTKMRVRTQSMLKASEVAENVAMLFKQDVSQTGAKSSMEAGAADAGAAYGNKYSDVYSAVYMDPSNETATLVDSSSFSIVDKGGFDSLTIRRIRYNSSGQYKGVEQVAWFVKEGTLWRNCKMIQKEGTLAADDPCADVGDAVPDDVEMATGVSEFNVIPATPSALGDAVQIFPAAGESEFRLVPRTDGINVSLTVSNEAGSVYQGGSIQTLAGFHSNYSTTSEAIVDAANRKQNEVIAIRNQTTTAMTWKSLCENYGKFTFEPGQEYEISFVVPYPGTTSDRSLMFVPEEDHMSVGFRDMETGAAPVVNGVVQVRDFMFFPPLDAKGGGERSMRFAVTNKIENVCLAFTFACFSPLVSQGKISIKNLKVRMVPSSGYDFSGFSAETHKNDKQNVKAFQLRLQIKRSGESGEATLVVPAPSNGPSD